MGLYKGSTQPNISGLKGGAGNIDMRKGNSNMGASIKGNGVTGSSERTNGSAKANYSGGGMNAQDVQMRIPSPAAPALGMRAAQASESAGESIPDAQNGDKA